MQHYEGHWARKVWRHVKKYVKSNMMRRILGGHTSVTDVLRKCKYFCRVLCVPSNQQLSRTMSDGVWFWKPLFSKSATRYQALSLKTWEHAQTPRTDGRQLEIASFAPQVQSVNEATLRPDTPVVEDCTWFLSGLQFLDFHMFSSSCPRQGAKKQQNAIRLKLIARVGLVTYEYEIYKKSIFGNFAAGPDNGENICF